MGGGGREEGGSGGGRRVKEIVGVKVGMLTFSIFLKNDRLVMKTTTKNR